MASASRTCPTGSTDKTFSEGGDGGPRFFVSLAALYALLLTTASPNRYAFPDSMDGVFRCSGID